MKLKFKKTPVLILSILLIPIFLLTGINYMFIDTSGGVTLLGAFALLSLSINIVVLFIEQLIVRKIKVIKKVWIVEISLILFTILFSIIFSN